jgi:transposase
MNESGKKPELSYSKKELILRWTNEGVIQKEIAKRLGIAESTVSYTLKNSVNGTPVSKKSLCGRKKALTDKEIMRVREVVEKDRWISGPKLANKVKRDLGKKISAKTAKRYIKTDGLKICTPRKVPLISNKNRKIRFEWAKKFLLKPKEYWKKVLWSDETKINLFCSDGRTLVWRREGEALNENLTRKTIKHGDSITLWGAICAKGSGNFVEIKGLMDEPKYVRIIQENLMDSVRKMGI